MLLSSALFPRCSRRLRAQLPSVSDDRFAGLQWRFVRIKYHYTTEGTTVVTQDFYGEPWAIDAPAAEQNLSRRIKTATTIQVEDPITLTLDDPRLFTYPVDLHRRAGQPEAHRQRRRDPARVPAARRHADLRRLSRPDRVGHMAAEMKRVFPDREIVDFPKEHPIFSCFYQSRQLSAGRRPRVVHGRPQLGEGRLRRAPAHHPRRHRPADAVHQLEHRHGRRLGVVERRGVSRLHEVHGAWRTAWASTKSSMRSRTEAARLETGTAAAVDPSHLLSIVL